MSFVEQILVIRGGGILVCVHSICIWEPFELVMLQKLKKGNNEDRYSAV